MKNRMSIFGAFLSALPHFDMTQSTGGRAYDQIMCEGSAGEIPKAKIQIHRPPGSKKKRMRQKRRNELK